MSKKQQVVVPKLDLKLQRTIQQTDERKKPPQINKTKQIKEKSNLDAPAIFQNPRNGKKSTSTEGQGISMKIGHVSDQISQKSGHSFSKTYSKTLSHGGNKPKNNNDLKVAGLTQQNLKKFMKMQKQQQKEMNQKVVESLFSPIDKIGLDPNSRTVTTLPKHLGLHKESQDQMAPRIPNYKRSDREKEFHSQQLEPQRAVTSFGLEPSQEYPNFCIDNVQNQVDPQRGGRITADLPETSQITRLDGQPSNIVLAQRDNIFNGGPLHTVGLDPKRSTSAAGDYLKLHLRNSTTLAPDASSSVSNNENIIGRYIQNQSKLKVNEDKLDSLGISSQLPFNQSIQNYSQKLLRQSEKLLQRNDYDQKQALNQVLDFQNLDGDNYDLPTRHLNGCSISPSGRQFLDESNDINKAQAKRRQRRMGMEKQGSSTGHITTNSLGNVNNKYAQKGLQQRQFKNPNKRCKSSNMTMRPPIHNNSRIKQQDVGQNQFQEYLDGNLKQNSTSSVPAQLSGSKLAVLNSTTLNILTASNTIAVQNQQQNQTVAKKQQKMLLKGVNEVVKRQTQNNRSRSHGQGGRSSSAAATIQHLQNGSRFKDHKPQKTNKRSATNAGTKSKVQPGSKMILLAKGSTTPKKVNASSMSPSSRRSTPKYQKSEGKKSLGKSLTRKSAGSDDRSGSRPPAVRSSSQGIHSGRRTVECLLADQLRNNRNKSSFNQRVQDPKFESEPKLQTVVKQKHSALSTVQQVDQETLQAVVANLRTGGQNQNVQNKTVRTTELSKSRLGNLNSSSFNNFVQPLSTGNNKLNKTSDKNRESLKIVQKINTSISAGTQKVDKIIKQNLRRHNIQMQESRQKQKEKADQNKRKKALIEEQNQQIMEKNRDQVLRRKFQNNTNKELGELSSNLFQGSVEDSTLAMTEIINGRRPRTQMKILSEQQNSLKQNSLISPIDDIAEVHADGVENRVLKLKGKNHRRSTFGLEFIDVRKEINAEMKKDEKGLKLKQSISQKNVKKFKKGQPGVLSQSSGANTFLRNISQNSAAMESLNKVAQRFNQQIGKKGGRDLGKSVGGSLTMNSYMAETSSQQQSQATTNLHNPNATVAILTEVQEEPNIKKKENIRKFMQKKDLEAKSKKAKETAAEISNIMKVQENLKKLNRYVVKKNTRLNVNMTAVSQPTKKISALRIKGVERKKNVTIVHEKLRPAKTKIAESTLIHKPRDFMDVPQQQTPGKQLLYENSDKSLRTRSKPDRIGQKKATYSENELYEQSKMVTSSLNTIEGRVDKMILKSNDTSSGNPARKVLQPNFQQSSNSQAGTTQILRQKNKSRESRSKNARNVPPYFEHSSRGSSSGSKNRLQNHSLRLKQSASRSPMGNKGARFDSNSNRSAQSPPPARSLQPKLSKVAVNKKGKKKSAPLRVPKGTKDHLRSTSRDQNNRSVSRDRDLNSNNRSVLRNQPAIIAGQSDSDYSKQNRDSSQSKRRKNQYGYPTKKFRRNHRDQLSAQGAAVMIQRAYRQHLSHQGFYVERMVTSAEKDPLINVYIEKNRIPNVPYQLQPVLQQNEKKMLDQQYNVSCQVSDRDSDYSQQVIKIHQTSPEQNIFRDKNSNNKRFIASTDEPSIASIHDATPDSSEAISIRDKQNKFARGKKQSGKIAQHKSANQLERVDENMPKPPPLKFDDNKDQKDFLASSPKSNSIQENKQEKKHEQALKNIKHKKILNELASVSSDLMHQSQFSQENHNDPPLIAGSIQLCSNSNIALQNNHTASQASMESVSQKSTNSVFDRNSFQNVSRQKLIDLMQNNEYQQLIQFREDWLISKEKKEKQAIKRLLKNNQCSPRAYAKKKDQIDKWVTIQKEDIRKTKQVYQEEWDKTVQMVEEAKVTGDSLKQQIVGQQRSDGKFKSVSSIHGANGQAISQASLTSQRSSIGVPEITGGNVRSSILIDEAPKSYRSGRQELPQGMNFNHVSEFEGKSEEGHVRSQGGIHSGRNQYFNLDDKRNSVDDGLSDRLNKGLEDGIPKLVGNKNSLEIVHEPSQELLDRLEKAFSKQSQNDDLSDGTGHNVSMQELDKLLSDAGMKNEDEDLNTINQEIAIAHQDGDVKPEDLFSPVNQEILINSIREDKKTSPSAADFIDSGVKDSVTDESPERQFADEPDVISPKPSKPLDSQNDMHDWKLRVDLGGPELDSNDVMVSPVKTPESNNLSEPGIITGGSANFETSPTSTFIDVKVRKSKLGSSKVEDTEADILKIIENPEQKEELVDEVTESIYNSILKQLVSMLPIDRNNEGKSEQDKPIKEKESNDNASDVYVIDTSQSMKEERREWIELHHRHNIERELFQSDTYITETLERLLLYEIDSSEDSSSSARSLQQFLQSLTQPIVREPIEVLSMLQNSESASYSHFETSFNISKFPIIPVDLYLEVERQRDEDDLQDRDRLKAQFNSSQELSIVQESIHIQNKCYFDALNESLMKFRPYGITGEPMPWSTKIRRLQTKVDINSVDTERLFQMVKHDVFRWSSAFCGSLPSSDFMFPARKNKEKFNDELFQETRDKRLTQVLQAETVEQEHHWLNFEFEEAQVKTDLSDMVLEGLVEEIADILNQKAGLPKVPKPKKETKKKSVKGDESGDQSISRLDSMFGDLQKYASSSRWQSNIDGESIISKDKNNGRTSVNSALKLATNQKINS